MTKGNRRLVLIIGALAVVMITLAGVLLLWPDEDKPAQATQVPKINSGPSASQVLDNFLKAAMAGQAPEAAALTDNPKAAEPMIAALAKNIPAGTLTLKRTGSADPQPGAASVIVPIKIEVKVTTANGWPSSVDMIRSGDKWLVRWAPTVIHPRLAEGQSIAVIGQTGEAGKPAVLGDDGKPIAIWEGSSAKPTDPRISPLLMRSLAGGSSAPGATDSRRISIVDAVGKELGEPLFGTIAAPTATEPVKSTLNPKIATAAQDAVAKSGQPAMIVAIKPSTGGILAVAQNDAAGTAPNALNGLYAPGSSFKIVTAAAAIQQQGMTLDADVQCPETANVGGRSLKNAGFGYTAPIKFRLAFAKSCNTTFGEIAGKLPADGLKKAASQFGLNADYTIPGITTELGKVEDAGSAVQRVEDSIGQGKIQASPLGMALVAATVAARRAVTPQLRTDSKTEVTTGYTAPSAAVLGQLQTMMGEVVSNGTATELKKFKGVAGKTGTAETESQGDNAHGWFVGYRGDVAFAVLVVDGKKSSVAVNVASAFLSGF